jgi:hypothetical protein
MATESAPPRPRPSRFDARQPKPAPKTKRPKQPGKAKPFRTVNRKRAELARLAIDWPRVVLEDMAEIAGVSRSAIASYRMGQREMPDHVALKLAHWLRERAQQQLDVAAQLERAASPEP